MQAQQHRLSGRCTGRLAISQDPDATLGEAAMRFTFSGQLAGTDVPLMTVDGSL
ncbi:MAG: hypothetical protein R2849_17545 [Thermomicrobiales bacterium]